MPMPGVHIETLHHPREYSVRQLEQAYKVATALGRGRLLLLEPPRAR